MKRRDVVRLASLAAAGAVTERITGRFLPPAERMSAGAAGGSGPGSSRWPEPAGVAAAEVRPHNGSPALFLDGKPVFPAINWVSGPTPDKWDFEEQARKSAATGIHIYAVARARPLEHHAVEPAPAHRGAPAAGRRP